MRARQTMTASITLIAGAVGFIAGQRASQAGTWCFVQTGKSAPSQCGSCDSHACAECDSGVCPEEHRVCGEQVDYQVLQQAGSTSVTLLSTPCFCDYECFPFGAENCDSGHACISNLLGPPEECSSTKFPKNVLNTGCVPM